MMKPILLYFATLLVFSGFTRAADGASHPNIIFFLADDVGWTHVGYQNPKVKTPNLDKLAAAGVVLDQHYVAPSCSPTRAALISGRCWSRFGLVNADEEQVFPFGTVTMASMLKASGYKTYIAGKWHLGSQAECGPLKFGFDHSFGCLGGGMGPYTHQKKLKGVSVLTRDDQPIEEEGHITDLIGQEVVKWIDSNGDAPFFIYVPFTAPHIPLSEPPEWMDLHKDAPDISHQLYWAAISHMDDQIGKIMTAVDRAGKTQNTLVFFAGDNGAPGQYNQAYIGDYIKTKLPGDNGGLRGRKQSLYEGGIRTPAFVTWPRGLKPGKVDAPLFVADWVPTLAGIVGYHPDKDPKWDGVDILPILSGAPAPADRSLYLLNYDGRALRQGDWKLVVLHSKNNEATRRTELYNLKDDPRERNDLATEKPEIVARLKALLDSEMAKDGDAVVPGKKNKADGDSEPP